MDEYSIYFTDPDLFDYFVEFDYFEQFHCSEQKNLMIFNNFVYKYKDNRTQQSIIDSTNKQEIKEQFQLRNIDGEIKKRSNQDLRRDQVEYTHKSQMNTMIK